MNAHSHSPLGFRDVTSAIDPRLVAAIGRFFGEDFSGVRFLQIAAGSAADRVSRAYGPGARAFAWSRTVLFPADREGVYASDAQWQEENARTIAHELWHIAELRATGVIRWCALFTREMGRYGLRGMRHADHEVRAREAAEAFIASEEFRSARAEALRQ